VTSSACGTVIPVRSRSSSSCHSTLSAFSDCAVTTISSRCRRAATVVGRMQQQAGVCGLLSDISASPKMQNTGDTFYRSCLPELAVWMDSIGRTGIVRNVVADRDRMLLTFRHKDAKREENLRAVPSAVRS